MATLYPLLSSLLSKRKTQEAWGLWRKSLLVALVSSVTIIIIGFTLAPFVIRVLGGKEFEASVIVLRILLFSLPLFFVNNLFYHSFLLKEKIKFPLIAIGSSAIINLVLNLIFIPRFGYIAAAFNTLISGVYVFIFYFLFFRNSRIKLFIMEVDE
jgi:O-antigen/teichoic acid export membrane protein